MERIELMEKALTADYGALKELGWLEVYEALKGWWPKRMAIEDLAPYLDALHEESAEKVMATLRGMRSEEWRPSPSSLYRTIQGLDAKSREAKDSQKDSRGFRKRPDEQGVALLRVRMLVEANHPVCSCPGRPTTIKVDRFDVLKCGFCGGLEQGQVFAAEDDEIDF